MADHTTFSETQLKKISNEILNLFIDENDSNKIEVYNRKTKSYLKKEIKRIITDNGGGGGGQENNQNSIDDIVSMLEVLDTNNLEKTIRDRLTTVLTSLIVQKNERKRLFSVEFLARPVAYGANVRRGTRRTIPRGRLDPNAIRRTAIRSALANMSARAETGSVNVYLEANGKLVASLNGLGSPSRSVTINEGGIIDLRQRLKEIVSHEGENYMVLVKE